MVWCWWGVYKTMIMVKWEAYFFSWLFNRCGTLLGPIREEHMLYVHIANATYWQDLAIFQATRTQLANQTENIKTHMLGITTQALGYIQRLTLGEVNTHNTYIVKYISRRFCFIANRFSSARWEQNVNVFVSIHCRIILETSEYLKFVDGLF